MRSSVLLCILSILVFAIELSAQDTKTPFIDQIGINLGINIPVGKEVLSEGAYPIGISMYLNLGHTTPSGQVYELLTGADVITDYGGGSYFAIPVLINRRYTLVEVGENLWMDGFIGMGYYFHHVSPDTEGITIKNQHTFGIDGGLLFNYRPGTNWDIHFRSGIFRSFTKPVEAYYAGQSITSENKFRYAVVPLQLGISRRLGAEVD